MFSNTLLLNTCSLVHAFLWSLVLALFSTLHVANLWNVSPALFVARGRRHKVEVAQFVPFANGSPIRLAPHAAALYFASGIVLRYKISFAGFYLVAELGFRRKNAIWQQAL